MQLTVAQLNLVSQRFSQKNNPFMAEIFRLQVLSMLREKKTSIDLDEQIVEKLKLRDIMGEIE